MTASLPNSVLRLQIRAATPLRSKIEPCSHPCSQLFSEIAARVNDDMIRLLAEEQATLILLRDAWQQNWANPLPEVLPIVQGPLAMQLSAYTIDPRAWLGVVNRQSSRSSGQDRTDTAGSLGP